MRQAYPGPSLWRVRRSLLRHRLIRKPGGFEGGTPVIERLVPNDLPVAKHPDPSAGFTNLHTAAFSTRPHLTQRDHGFAMVEEPIHVQANVFECVIDHRPKLADSLVAMESAGIGRVRILDPDDLGVE